MGGGLIWTDELFVWAGCRIMEEGSVFLCFVSPVGFNEWLS